MTSFAAVLLAAGQSRRMNGLIDDKILAILGGRPVFIHTIEAFLKSEICETFVLVYRDVEQRKRIADFLAPSRTGFSGKVKFEYIQGGAQRQDSVFSGLSALPETVDYVFIHDCARPLVAPSLLKSLAQTVVRDKAVVLARRVTDTIKRVPEGTDDLRALNLETLDRSRLWAMETPQVFERALITEAYRSLRTRSVIATDDAAAAELKGHKITLLENLFPNPKLTTPDDFAFVEYLISKRGADSTR